MVQTRTHANIRQQTEWDKVNYLVGNALISPTVCHRLLRGDVKLAKEYEISELKWQHIRAIKAKNLDDFCGKLLSLKPLFTI